MAPPTLWNEGQIPAELPMPSSARQQPSSGQPLPQDRQEVWPVGVHWQVVRPRPGEVPEAEAVFTDWLEQSLPTSSQVTAPWGCCSGYAQFRLSRVCLITAGAAQPAGHGMGAPE